MRCQDIILLFSAFIGVLRIKANQINLQTTSRIKIPLATITFYDPTKGMNFESLIADEGEFKEMMELQTAEELLSFLSQRTIA